MKHITEGAGAKGVDLGNSGNEWSLEEGRPNGYMSTVLHQWVNNSHTAAHACRHEQLRGRMAEGEPGF